MTLGNIFSDAQISALKSIATAPTDAEKYTTNVSEETWEILYDIAASLGQKLSPKFWQMLDANICTNLEVMVCMKGKKEVSVIPVMRHTAFARHIGQKLKSGYSIVWIGKTTTIVTWDNWKRVYSTLSGNLDTNEYDTQMSKSEYRRIKNARRKEREFYELAEPIRSKKGGRCRITFEEAQAQRIKSEKLMFECKVEARARKIFLAALQ